MSRATPALPPDRREGAFVLLLVALAAALRFYRLGSQSLWIDEFLMIQRASLGEPFRWADWFVNPQGPLPALVLRFWTHLAGTSEAALRLPSAVFGTLTVPAVYALARRMNRSAGIPAATLAALSPFLVWYSQETRHYALAFLAAACAAWAILRLEKLPAPRARDFLAVSAGLLAGLMSHLTIAFSALAQFGALLLRKPRTLAWRWAIAVVPVFEHGN